MGLLLALACTAGAGTPRYQEAAAADADVPAGATEVGRLAVDAIDQMPPAAFAVDAAGRATVLLVDPPRLVRLGSDGAAAPAVTLHGEGFPADQAGPVDLALRESGEVLVLDAAVGTLWRVATDGTVLGRHGHFVAPTKVRLGPGGRVLVTDPGSASVVVLDRDLTVEAVRRGEDLAPALSADLGIPFLRLRTDGSGAQLGLVPLTGTSPSVERLAVIPAPAGHDLMSAEVLGASAGDILVLTGAAPRQGPGARFQLHRIPREGDAPPAVDIPWLGSGCLDCGPTYRAGPGARLHGYLLRRDLYRVLRIDTEGTDQG